MAERTMRAEVLITARDRASAVVGRLRQNVEGANKGMAVSLKSAGGGWRALGGGIAGVAGVASIVLPGIGTALTAMSFGLNTIVTGARAALVAVGRLVEVGVTGLKRLALAAGIAGAAVGALAFFSAKTAMGMEQTRNAYIQMLGSARAANIFIRELLEFAAKTPFEFEQLTNLGTRLLAFGFLAHDIIPMLTDIGDAIGALGGGTEKLQRVIVAFGQVKAKGKLSMEEVLQFAEAGIPVFEILREKLGLTQAEMGRIGDQGIPAAKAIAALRAGLQERFGGGMARQASSALGQVSMLRDAWYQLRLIIGAPMPPIIAKVLAGITASLTGLLPRAQKLMQSLLSPETGAKIVYVAELITTALGDKIGKAIDWLTARSGDIVAWARLIIAWVGYIGKALFAAAPGGQSVIARLWETMKGWANWIWTSLPGIVVMVTGVLGSLIRGFAVAEGALLAWYRNWRSMWDGIAVAILSIVMVVLVSIDKLAEALTGLARVGSELPGFEWLRLFIAPLEGFDKGIDAMQAGLGKAIAYFGRDIVAQSKAVAGDVANVFKHYNWGVQLEGMGRQWADRLADWQAGAPKLGDVSAMPMGGTAAMTGPGPVQGWGVATPVTNNVTVTITSPFATPPEIERSVYEALRKANAMAQYRYG